MLQWLWKVVCTDGGRVDLLMTACCRAVVAVIFVLSVVSRFT